MYFENGNVAMVEFLNYSIGVTDRCGGRYVHLFELGVWSGRRWKDKRSGKGSKVFFAMEIKGWTNQLEREL